jgi:hypothetical protein
LIARELENTPWIPPGTPGGEAEEVAGVFIGRITYDILRPVPIAPLRVEVEVVRPGRSVELLSAVLLDDGGEPLIRASAWRLAEHAVEIPAGLPRGIDPVPGPEQGTEEPFFEIAEEVGYHTAMENRFVRGAFRELGPATVWMRMRHPLVEGEQPSPLQRLLTAADSGNGVSATLDLSRYIFINVDLTVHVHRQPCTEWVCLDAITIPEPTGIGLADTVLHDERGPIGRALQTLLVRER